MSLPRSRKRARSFFGKNRLAALFSDISFAYGGKKRGFCRLR
jgi:hypothetical protein